MPIQFQTPNGILTASTYNEGVLLLAAEFGQQIGFRYSKADGRVIEPRRVEPEGFVKAKDGAVSVVGFDPDRDDVRAFRLDRIVGSVSA